MKSDNTTATELTITQKLTDSETSTKLTFTNIATK